MADAVANVAEVELDEEGQYKYILIEAKIEGEGSGHLVRGTASAEYHKDIFEKVEKELKPKGISLKCLGGGKIERGKAKSVRIFGKSEGYGRADHEITAGIIKKALPGISVTVDSKE